MDQGYSPGDRFTRALHEQKALFKVHLDSATIARLREYYEMILVWNPRLHLVAPCSPEEFATRHILESLLAIANLTIGARVIDVGSGAGLPVIPCLIARPDLHATLIEASKKKAVFLREALRRVDPSGGATVIAERFEQIGAPQADFVMCRALEQFGEMFQTLVQWSPKQSTLLFFGGESLRDKIEKAELSYEAIHVPATERRSLFMIRPG